MAEFKYSVCISKQLKSQCFFLHQRIMHLMKKMIYDEMGLCVRVCGGGAMGDSGSQDLIFPDFTSFIGTLRRL